MGLFDKFKGKKTEISGAPAASAVTAEKPQTAPVSAVSSPKKAKGHMAAVADLLVRPILSEKGTHLAGKGSYVFAVNAHANKPEIKKNVEAIYHVTVTDVRVLKMPGKMRRYGRSSGKTSAVKKAIITLKAGDKIPGIIESVG